jgi:hypothetical protein
MWGMELLWCLQAYAKTSHKPARSVQQTDAQEASSVDVFGNTRVHKWSSTLFPIMLIIFEDRHMGTHTRITSFSVWTGTYTHTRTHTHTPWAMMNAYACQIESSKPTLSTSVSLCQCVKPDCRNTWNVSKINIIIVQLQVNCTAIGLTMVSSANLWLEYY